MVLLLELRRRQLLDILKDLHSTGYAPKRVHKERTKLTQFPPSIQDELDLPQIVVVGSQSVGKSSLIESMSGVRRLPSQLVRSTSKISTAAIPSQRYRHLHEMPHGMQASVCSDMVLPDCPPLPSRFRGSSPARLARSGFRFHSVRQSGSGANASTSAKSNTETWR